MKYLSLFAIILATVGVFDAIAAPAAGQSKGTPPPSHSPSATAPTATVPTASSAPLPSVTVTINGQNIVYPALDRTPDLNDPVVQGWLKEIDLSHVPNLPVSNGGVINYNQAQCGSPTQILPNQGSWTCQKIVRPDDVVQCPTPKNWGLTYDDGPSPSTPMLLTTLQQLNLKATFFVVGSRVISNPQTLKAAYAAGHHIAVHTWSHPALCSVPNESIVAELKWTMKAIHDVIGVTPIYMRPPYGDTDDRVRYITAAVGLKTVIWTEGFDTDDWSLRPIPGVPPTSVQHVLTIFSGWMDNLPNMKNGFIVLEHDLFPQTVKAAVQVITKAATIPGLNITTVPQCIGDSKPYLELGGTPPPSPSQGNSTNKSPSGSSSSNDPGVTAASTSDASAVIIHITTPIITVGVSVFFSFFYGTFNL